MQEKLMVKRQMAMRDSGTLVGRQMPLVWILRFLEMVSPWSASARNRLVEVSSREESREVGRKESGIDRAQWREGREEGGKMMII